ncbi:MAG: arsenite efflux transporter metallochaperone ArsD [Pseudorhodobacter sp.]|nr:arsenite efflux transporter metallochaperone ArsD [Pseudorhodobacter sp.]
MTTITVYDPAMCCSTGICGTDVDQRLVDLAADLDWLKAQGVSVRRINLSQEPMEFVTNPEIKALMDASDGADLPAIMVGDKVVSTARYPARAELANWAGLARPAVEITEQIRELIALGAAIGTSCEPCLKYHTQKGREVGLSDDAMREAVAIGRRVKEASAKNILGLSEKLIPAAAAVAGTTGCCGGGKTTAMEAPAQATASTGCCGGSAKSGAKKVPEKAGACC